MCKMLEGIKAICYKCGEVKMTNKFYHLQGRGYGSIFDGINAYIPVCEDCDTTELEKWIYETPVIVDYVETYKYEQQLKEYIDTFDERIQDFIYNADLYQYIMDNNLSEEVALGNEN